MFIEQVHLERFADNIAGQIFDRSFDQDLVGTTPPGGIGHEAPTALRVLESGLALDQFAGLGGDVDDAFRQRVVHRLGESKREGLVGSRFRRFPFPLRRIERLPIGWAHSEGFLETPFERLLGCILPSFVDHEDVSL